MKNVYIMGVHKLLGEGDHTKIYIYNIYIYGELSKKWGLDNLQGAWQKIGRRVFLRGGD